MLSRRRLRVLTSVGLLAALLVVPKTVIALQEAPVQNPTGAVLARTTNLPSRVTLPPDLFQQQSSTDRQVWAQNLAQAKARHRRSTWFLVGAAGLVGLGIINQATEEEGYTYVTTAGVSPAVFFYIFGGGLGAYGFYERTQSQRDIQDLEAEGRRRGFAFAISPKGAAIGYVFTF